MKVTFQFHQLRNFQPNWGKFLREMKLREQFEVQREKEMKHLHNQQILKKQLDRYLEERLERELERMKLRVALPMVV